MPQGKGKRSAPAHTAGKNKQGKSAGAIRRQLGKTAKNMRSQTMKPNAVRAEASRSFNRAVETAMANKLPSVQRQKLTIVRSTGIATRIPNRKKGMKKPLVRGRKRKEKKL